MNDANDFFRKWYWSYDMEKYDGEHEEYSALEMIDFAEAYYKEKTDGENLFTYNLSDLFPAEKIKKEAIEYAIVDDDNVPKGGYDILECEAFKAGVNYILEKLKDDNQSKSNFNYRRKELIDFADGINVHDGDIDKIGKLVDIYLKHKNFKNE